MGSEPSCESKASALPNGLPEIEESKSFTLTTRPARSTLTASGLNLSSLSPATASRSQLHTAQPVLDELQLDVLSSPSSSSRRSTIQHKRRKSSVLIVHNGVTGQFISTRICKIGAKFWHKHVDTLSVEQQLEIGCSIFFAMLSANGEMKKLMKTSFNDKQKIEQTSIKFLDMTGWLIRYLITDNIDLQALLQKLGTMHRAMGIKIQHFNPMLQAMHETFSYYFDHQYTIDVKYAFDEIFALAAQLMMNEPLRQSSHLMALSEQFQGTEIPFLKGLDVCLQSNIGKEYLYRYLQQTWCDEMVIFLQTLSRFKSMTCDKERFMVARDIIKTCIEPSAAFAVNISYECRENALRTMRALEQKFATKQSLVIPESLFEEVEHQVIKLILENHWIPFNESIQMLQNKSFHVE
eukprot:CAMPEP_0197030852 /NCGR_PEP_ID=MMETSP1384-20130603/9995_1 /TAXON_ID=29189 /ORGANISM="Ammonia sp." /LENGTH=407 /DNA_ID=CAMNT_0042460277 /DNA_START=1 /DNA_END=1224 /DNA_ORIENTATION=+